MSAGWTEQAACRDADPELFFPTGDGSLAYRQAYEAATYCWRCPALEACADRQAQTGSCGVWAGVWHRPANLGYSAGSIIIGPQHARLWRRRRRLPPAPPRPCGTHAAYVRHVHDGEQPCANCGRAERAYQRGKAAHDRGEPAGADLMRRAATGDLTDAELFYRRGRKPKPEPKPRRRPAPKPAPEQLPRELRPHGTHAAFMRHRNAREEPCPACRDGERAYQRGRKRQWRDGRLVTVSAAASA